MTITVNLGMTRLAGLVIAIIFFPESSLLLPPLLLCTVLGSSQRKLLYGTIIMGQHALCNTLLRTVVVGT